MKTALTIAGSDSSGGAGIQADIKTMTMNGVFATSAITALTAQNTTGVTGILDVTPEFLQQQIDAVFNDIFPDAVKIGMVGTSALIETIANSLEHYQARNIVVDPVMVATSGAKLICDDAIETLKAQQYGCAALCKGGHNLNDANDYLFDPAANNGAGAGRWFEGKRIDNPNTHGTGCTLSSAIASNLAKGYSLEQAVFRAKEYISGALSAMLDLGAGSGPMNHAFTLSENTASYFAQAANKQDIK